MVRFYYSPSRKGFFTDDSLTVAIPADGIEISRQYHAELLDGESLGRLIVPDVNGYPVLVDRPPPPYNELREAEYPDFRLYLDGVVKGDDAQIQAYIDACLAVKEKYPKP